MKRRFSGETVCPSNRRITIPCSLATYRGQAMQSVGGHLPIVSLAGTAEPEQRRLFRLRRLDQGPGTEVYQAVNARIVRCSVSALLLQNTRQQKPDRVRLKIRVAVAGYPQEPFCSGHVKDFFRALDLTVRGAGHMLLQGRCHHVVRPSHPGIPARGACCRCGLCHRPANGRPGARHPSARPAFGKKDRPNCRPAGPSSRRSRCVAGRDSPRSTAGCGCRPARRQFPNDSLYKGIDNRFEWRCRLHGGSLCGLRHPLLSPGIQTTQKTRSRGTSLTAPLR